MEQKGAKITSNGNTDKLDWKYDYLFLIDFVFHVGFWSKNVAKKLTIYSSESQTLRGFLRMYTALLRKICSAFGSGEHWR
jgi:hypothetical protein